MPDLSRRQSSRQKGDRGEELALRYLAKKGYEALERNYRTRHGEIDLILRGERALVFVEVKLRRGTGFGDPLEAVTPKKQAKVRLMAEQYLAERGDDFVTGFDEVRFDVVGILASGAGRPEIRHVEDAF
ncbi:MAG: YraN family protein [Actinobacteria bacterium]|nr:YraN family protein [Actinomycetota bacterium]